MSILLLLALTQGATDGLPSDPEPPRAAEVKPVTSKGGVKPALGPLPTAEYIETVNRFARTPGIGLQVGPWGRGGVLGLRTDIPFGWSFGQYCGLRLGVNFVMPLHASDVGDPLLFGAGELFGRSPVIMGLARFYGGGGAHLGGSVVTTHGGKKLGVSGGGFFGLELFAAPTTSFNVEIGGQYGLHPSRYDAGLQVTGGMAFHFWRS